MGKFLEMEKVSQTRFKKRSPYFSESTRLDGVYRKKPRPFCIPVEFAEQNLFPWVRRSAPAFFKKHGIKWHDGQNGKPSNHLCSSQVFCVNFLFPFADKPDALKMLLEPIYPKIRTMLPVEDGMFVTFEWIGERNYLGEKTARNDKRTRGANFTSADAVAMFERTDTKRQIVLIEWKYTEAYGSSLLTIASNGTDRTEIYRPLFDLDDCPVNKEILPSFDDLFYEPFYQFMRQQFLANEMEKAHEMGADLVSVLHIAPSKNKDFQKITSPGLIDLGSSAIEMWKKLQNSSDRFVSVTTEELFSGISQHNIPEISSWMKYMSTRYAWLSGNG